MKTENNYTAPNAESIDVKIESSVLTNSPDIKIGPGTVNPEDLD